MSRDRQEIARAAASALESAPAVEALVGFDGFIDSIIDAVDLRTDMGPTGYRKIRTIKAFAERCAGAAGRSANIERVVRERRFGGNGPLLAGVPGIWRGLMREVLPRVSAAPRRVMIDLSDPSKRTDDDVRGAMDLLRSLNESGPAVTLGLNLNEAGRIGRLAGLRVTLALDSPGDDVARAAAAIRERLRL